MGCDFGCASSVLPSLPSLQVQRATQNLVPHVVSYIHVLYWLCGRVHAQHMTLMDGEMIVDDDMVADKQSRRYLAYDLITVDGPAGPLSKPPLASRPFKVCRLCEAAACCAMCSFTVAAILLSCLGHAEVTGLQSAHVGTGLQWCAR